MAAHSNSTKVHRPYRWVVADATAKAALTNSPEPGETSLLTKLLLQEDTRDIYELVDDAPMTWKLVMPGYEAATDGDVLVIDSGVPTWIAGGGGVPGPAGADGQGYTWRGAWVSGTSYAPYDNVSYSGSTYTCILSVSGTTNPSADATHW